MTGSQGSARPDELDRKRGHAWVAVASGRVCSQCMKTQATSEFDDTPDCPGARKPGA